MNFMYLKVFKTKEPAGSFVLSPQNMVRLFLKIPSPETTKEVEPAGSFVLSPQNMVRLFLEILSSETTKRKEIPTYILKNRKVYKP